MKPIYKSLALAAMTLQVSLALGAQTYDGETTSETALPAEVLDSLRAELIAPNVSGARDLIKSGECMIDGANLAITLNAGNWIKGATYRVQVVATFGTQTQVIYALDVTVPYYVALSNTPQEYEDTVTVVSTIGDGDKSGADASVYAKNNDGSAHITKPLSISDGIATSNGAVASGHTDGDGSRINASGDGAVASGYTDGDGSYIEASGHGAVASGRANGENSYIEASGDGAVASGCMYGDGSYIEANGDGAVASGRANGDGSYIVAGGIGAVANGYTNGENSYIGAGGNGAVASGYADGDGSCIQADGSGAVASGYANSEEGGNVIADGDGSMAIGIGVQAIQNGQAVVGQCNVVDEDDSYQFIVGNGADDDHRHNAFAVTKSGELALFEADGTPVILTAADLKALIASLQ